MCVCVCACADIDQLITISGMVIRTSPLIPEMREGETVSSGNLLYDMLYQGTCCMICCIVSCMVVSGSMSHSLSPSPSLSLSPPPSLSLPPSPPPPLSHTHTHLQRSSVATCVRKQRLWRSIEAESRSRPCALTARRCTAWLWSTTAASSPTNR